MPTDSRVRAYVCARVRVRARGRRCVHARAFCVLASKASPTSMGIELQLLPVKQNNETGKIPLMRQTGEGGEG